MRIASSILFTVIAVFGFVTLPARAQQTDGKHFLWRVTSVPQPFYLLGSYHALRAGDYPLGAAVDEAIENSKRFVFEIDHVHNDWARVQREMRDAAHYPAGITLKQKVNPKTYAYVQKIAKTRASMYDDVKPWAIAFFMFHHPAFYNVSNFWGVENYVHRKSALFAAFGGLETAEEHIQVLSDMSDVEGEIFLLQAMVYSDQGISQFRRGVEAYKRGDTEGLQQVYAQQEHEAPFLFQRLIDRRNVKWIPRIENEMKSGKPTMIVVGARHLCGANSVISLLRARGYKLEQL